MFALRIKGSDKLLGFESESNGDAEFSCDVAFSLAEDTDNVWVVTDRKVAEKAAVTSAKWYNAGFNTPTNYYVDPQGRLMGNFPVEIEVVELSVK